MGKLRWNQTGNLRFTFQIWVERKKCKAALRTWWWWWGDRNRFLVKAEKWSFIRGRVEPQQYKENHFIRSECRFEMFWEDIADGWSGQFGAMVQLDQIRPSQEMGGLVWQIYLETIWTLEVRILIWASQSNSGSVLSSLSSWFPIFKRAIMDIWLKNKW